MPFLRLSPHTRLMSMVEAIRVVEGVTSRRRRPNRTANRFAPRADEVNLHTFRLDQLRDAVRNNSVSFPSQVPIFERHDRPDLQRRIVQLYFLCGWSCATIAARYGMIRQRIGQVLNTWKRRAVETGYIQYIPPQPAPAYFHKTIQVYLSPVVGESPLAARADSRGLPGVAVWAHANEILMNPIQKSYETGT